MRKKCKGVCEQDYDEVFLDERGICRYCSSAASSTNKHLKAMNNLRFSPSPIPPHLANPEGKNDSTKEESDPA